MEPGFEKESGDMRVEFEIERENVVLNISGYTSNLSLSLWLMER